jgi:hypothetical protein
VLGGIYDFRLVALSLFIAVLASRGTLDLGDRLTRNRMDGYHSKPISPLEVRALLKPCSDSCPIDEVRGPVR